jgi:hypothetical protein
MKKINIIYVGQKIKCVGVWEIHKNDKDPFPNDPHGDRVDKPEKLDLYTGKVYDRATRKYLRKLPTKKMLQIYSKIMTYGEDNVIAKLKANEHQITYLKPPNWRERPLVPLRA